MMEGVRKIPVPTILLMVKDMAEAGDSMAGKVVVLDSYDARSRLIVLFQTTITKSLYKYITL